jgi:hypothetical protein
MTPHSTTLRSEPVAIPLTKGLVALVDAEDAERVLAAGPWHAHVCPGTTYACHRGSRPEKVYVHMHRLILGVDTEVDHINGDGLDNRRANLRTATHSQNQANAPKQSRVTTSRYRGVSWFARTRRWQAHITVAGKHRGLGYFDTEEEAALAYDNAASEAFGEYVHPNLDAPEAVARLALVHAGKCPDGHGALLLMANGRLLCAHVEHAGRPRSHPLGPLEPTPCFFQV